MLKIVWFIRIKKNNINLLPSSQANNHDPCSRQATNFTIKPPFGIDKRLRNWEEYLSTNCKKYKESCLQARFGGETEKAIVNIHVGYFSTDNDTSYGRVHNISIFHQLTITPSKNIIFLCKQDFIDFSLFRIPEFWRGSDKFRSDPLYPWTSVIWSMR